MLRMIFLIFILILSVACGAAEPAETKQAEAIVPTPTAETQESTGDVSDTNLVSEAILVWEGHTDMPDGDTESCKSLVVMNNNAARIGPCGAADTAVQLLPIQQGDWAEIVAHFTPFESNTPEEKLVFQGQGQAAGEVWQRALANWTRFTYSELATGRASASVRTVLSWWLGELPGRPGYCRHLIVLSHGYAYANVDPCEGGGEPGDSVRGWLETGELEQFDGWLYSRGFTDQNNNYFSGQEGLQPMSEAELTELSTWAETVYNRLAN